MINSIIAYSIPELEKKIVLSEAETLYKSKLLSEEQWQKIREEFASKLYTPSVFMKVLLFIFSLIGMITIIGPIVLLMGNIEESGYRFICLLLGSFLIFFTEGILIRKKLHYKSGITEAGIYSGLLFIAYGLVGFDHNSELVYPIIGFVFAAIAAIRYLNIVALLISIVFFIWILFQLITDIGGMAEALMPFIFMAIFGFIYWLSIKLKARLSNVIFENQFIIIKTLALILFYIAGNYYVVRELSIELMDLNLSDQDDIPFAFVFYALTALVPVGFIYWGIKQKSILFLRVGLLTIALSAVTFKYYFSLGHPIVTLTVSGAILIIIALVFFNYLKQIRDGFTREILLHDKWSTKDLTAIIASQTLGGNKIDDSVENTTVFKGGSFGGAGAGGNW